MKSKFIVVVTVLITALVVYIFLRRSHRELPEVIKYSVTSNTGVVIPARLYSRVASSTIDGKEEVINELILAFDDKLILDGANLSGDQKLYKYLVLVPTLKMIGLVDHIDALKEKDKYIWQGNDEASNFTSIVNNYTYFSDPPIKNAVFLNGEVVFNTYGVLKRFGDHITVKYH